MYSYTWGSPASYRLKLQCIITAKDLQIPWGQQVCGICCLSPSTCHALTQDYTQMQKECMYIHTHMSRGA